MLCFLQMISYSKDLVSNLDEHLYLLLGQEIVRLPIQKPYQISVYKAGKRLSIMQSPVDWREIFMKQSVGKCKQINLQNLCVVRTL